MASQHMVITSDHQCLGLEINLAGSADFLDPNFQKSNFTHHQHYPPNLYPTYSNNNITIPITNLSLEAQNYPYCSISRENS